ncbi:bifunctional adenosylcobinamide kinase/adenosylcobinamide-phosphate guanylyltransferase [Consotaella salsifontis]|uniref:Bifunctional adenosylcobalamin biosynthesis protein n=1 Tax=Consotaella salsifontis TaxID=1365950 RepID=A0A1T4SJT5_9HYPH|nr:bifunctional adenosylcobinamide kinase/adenosylcobinamide-phosphate guanylyltransferase [Consotaella salsifontis]SKA28178.1 adenosylcobinamide kinase /adenosylcobinamide-phosphate guanylyltransferase [Consotaella salsifontis]
MNGKAEPAGAVLVLGGARSGKSAFAERRIEEIGRPARYVATAEIWDEEMRERIARHRARRGPLWSTVEAPLDLVGALEEAPADMAILVDCLTLWLTNLMLAERDIGAESRRLTEWLSRPREARVFLVANEVGLGIVPDNALARAFRDHAGRLNQAVAAIATEVHFLAAGLPLRLKG